MDRESFFKQQELRIFTVDIEGFGTVRAKELTNGERIKHYDLWLAPNGETDKGRLRVAREKMISLCLLDDAGNLLLSEDDISKLKAFPARVVSQLTELAMKCLGLSEEDVSDQLKKKPADYDETSKPI